MMGILVKALWATLFAYILFVIGRRIYIKSYKKSEDPFFYFLSLKIDEKGNCFLRIDAPFNEFEIEINVLENEKVTFNKNAHLKMGINKILISTIPKNRSEAKIKIQSATQIIERSFVEVEN